MDSLTLILLRFGCSLSLHPRSGAGFSPLHRPPQGMWYNQRRQEERELVPI
ncbi:MAG: hypothetical protein HC884_03195 [Chloroflexaceae bacterium]|nr:hypothetical protein [Chloroflexaceae bacterium]